ncbi:hypothetical protein VNO77_39000 [Canavalia gladiata]|uniref:Uncharacterized protein n=1 Tax=Canavalia gladiata TaxID=3824 RepID=A0AAN9KBF1_CANGL
MQNDSEAIDVDDDGLDDINKKMKCIGSSICKLGRKLIQPRNQDNAHPHIIGNQNFLFIPHLLFYFFQIQLLILHNLVVMMEMLKKGSNNCEAFISHEFEEGKRRVRHNLHHYWRNEPLCVFGEREGRKGLGFAQPIECHQEIL